MHDISDTFVSLVLLLLSSQLLSKITSPTDFNRIPATGKIKQKSLMYDTEYVTTNQDDEQKPYFCMLT
jgi:hypothetical protein